MGKGELRKASVLTLSDEWQVNVSHSVKKDRTERGVPKLVEGKVGWCEKGVIHGRLLQQFSNDLFDVHILTHIDSLGRGQNDSIEADLLQARSEGRVDLWEEEKIVQRGEGRQ